MEAAIFCSVLLRDQPIPRPTYVVRGMCESAACRAFGSERHQKNWYGNGIIMAVLVNLGVAWIRPI